MNLELKKYYLFIDESGAHGLVNLDPSFPVFLLCGMLLSESNYQLVKEKINSLKHKFWDDKEVILHSRDIRKCEKEFQVLFDLDLKKEFYKDINAIITNSNYRIISSAIQRKIY